MTFTTWKPGQPARPTARDATCSLVGVAGRGSVHPSGNRTGRTGKGQIGAWLITNPPITPAGSGHTVIRSRSLRPGRETDARPLVDKIIPSRRRAPCANGKRIRRDRLRNPAFDAAPASSPPCSSRTTSCTPPRPCCGTTARGPSTAHAAAHLHAEPRRRPHPRPHASRRSTGRGGSYQVDQVDYAEAVPDRPFYAPTTRRLPEAQRRSRFSSAGPRGSPPERLGSFPRMTPARTTSDVPREQVHAQ